MDIAGKIKSFFREVATEARKVDWPDRQTTFKHTAIVIGISLGVAGFLGLLDFFFLRVVINNLVF